MSLSSINIKIFNISFKSMLYIKLFDNYIIYKIYNSFFKIFTRNYTKDFTKIMQQDFPNSVQPLNYKKANQLRHMF
jgi:hypothetical protein